MAADTLHKHSKLPNVPFTWLGCGLFLLFPDAVADLIQAVFDTGFQQKSSLYAVAPIGSSNAYEFL